jgi:hypothetical protein
MDIFIWLSGFLGKDLMSRNEILVVVAPYLGLLSEGIPE